MTNFPINGSWADGLHWCLRVMDGDDPAVGFIASLLSYADKWGSLTEKQARAAAPIIMRVNGRRVASRLKAEEMAQGRPEGATLQ